MDRKHKVSINDVKSTWAPSPVVLDRFLLYLLLFIIYIYDIVSGICIKLTDNAGFGWIRNSKETQQHCRKTRIYNQSG